MIKKMFDLFIARENLVLVEAMQKIDSNANGVLFVVDKNGILCGSVSDGDIRRWILKSGKLDVEIRLLMNKAPKFIYTEELRDPYQYMKDIFIRALPVLDREHHIQEIVLLNEKNEIPYVNKCGLENVSVVVMAGGKGTRLYPYTKILPKPLIPIGDVPIIERIINRFNEYGVTDFFLTVNYRKNMIRSYFSEIERTYDIVYVEENEPLGTAGSIRLIQKKFKIPLFITNCDILIQADYSDIYKYHMESGNAITIVVAMKNDIIPYGVVYPKNNGEIERLEEKPRRAYFINTGMYIINPETIDLIPKNTFFHMTHLTEKAIQQEFKVGMYPVSADSFLDMGEMEEMKRMEEKLNLKS